MEIEPLSKKEIAEEAAALHGRLCADLAVRVAEPVPILASTLPPLDPL